MEEHKDYYALEAKIDRMIDELQGLCSQNGLSNTAAEEAVVTSVFLYKFLSDKYTHNLKKFAEELGVSAEEVVLNENKELDAFYHYYPTDVVLRSNDTIQSLVNKTGRPGFATMFDDALERISNYPENDKFKVNTASGEKEPLFSRITENIIDKNKRDAFAVAIFGIISESKFDFGYAFEGTLISTAPFSNILLRTTTLQAELTQSTSRHSQFPQSSPRFLLVCRRLMTTNSMTFWIVQLAPVRSYCIWLVNLAMENLATVPVFTRRMYPRNPHASFA